MEYPRESKNRRKKRIQNLLEEKPAAGAASERFRLSDNPPSFREWGRVTGMNLPLPLSRTLRQCGSSSVTTGLMKTGGDREGIPCRSAAADSGQSAGFWRCMGHFCRSEAMGSEGAVFYYRHPQQ